jgi:hypothetical protein
MKAMNLGKILRSTAALLLASVLLQAAHAELVLYDEPDFRGSRISLDNAVDNMKEVRFNDRAQSIMVSREAWQVCVDADFRGACITLRPGQYRFLDQGFANAISSARPLQGGGPGYPPPGVGEGGRGEITLYDQPNFGGRSITFRDSAANVGREFNDRTSSIVVRDGNWLLCVDEEFRGACMVASPGEYRSLDRTFTDSITSIRPTGGNGSPGYERPPQSGNDRPPAWRPGEVGSGTFCSAQPRGRCEGCTVECARGQRAICTQGMTWDDRLNDGNRSCAVRSACECR